MLAFPSNINIRIPHVGVRRVSVNPATSYASSTYCTLSGYP